jgi:predicted outer membrane repeat protein
VAVSFTTVAFNRAEDAGAAIDVGANSEAHIACCTFFGNSAKMKGGAISGSSGPIFTVSFSTFFNNMAGEGEWLSALPRAARASRARR